VILGADMAGHGSCLNGIELPKECPVYFLLKILAAFLISYKKRMCIFPCKSDSFDVAACETLTCVVSNLQWKICELLYAQREHSWISPTGVCETLTGISLNLQCKICKIPAANKTTKLSSSHVLMGYTYVDM
jgi:hypothetical protein